MALELNQMLGKTRKDLSGNNVPGFTVLEHSILVGAAAVALLRNYPELCATEEEVRDMAYFFSLHDVGKVSPGFQAQISCALNHNSVSTFPGTGGITFKDLCSPSSPFCRFHEEGAEWHFDTFYGGGVNPKLDMGPTPRHILRMHHGGIRNIGHKHVPLQSSTMGGGVWVDLRDKLCEELNKVFPGNLPDESFLEENEEVLTGLLCISDWIGSDEDVFETDPGKKEYPFKKGWKLQDLVATAEKAIIGRKLGCGVSIPKNQSFGDIFNGWEPKPEQTMLVDAVTGPGVYILEAPMGLGKTEAALYAAYKCLDKGWASGIYFGLPTQVTSNKIHSRFPFAKTQLIHGGSKLYLKKKGRTPSHHSWYSNNKRCLLAPIGVGTIDQALLSVIKTAKHYFLRILGLHKKVLILDEVHSYDAYTSRLMKNLIKKGHIVIVLSATLTAEAKRIMLGLNSTDPVSSVAYPQVTSFKGNISSTSSTTNNIPDKDYKLFFKEKQDLMEKAETQAKKGYKVLWFENTVDEAQESYNKFSGVRKGLLHSRFIKKDRNIHEEVWLDNFGKENKDTEGSILVTTQVAEQSLDIDADVMYTSLCPADMLLQRAGRVWRHERTRPKGLGSPEIYIHVGKMDPSKDDIHKFAKAYGGKTPYVYEPYILMRTRDVLRNEKSILIPSGIRGILERTYEDVGTYGSWKNLMDSKTKVEQGKADKAVTTSGNFGTGDDSEEEKFGTRLITDTMEVVLIDKVVSCKEVEIDGNVLDLTDYRTAPILDENKIKVSPKKMGFVPGSKEATCVVELNHSRFPTYVVVKKGHNILDAKGNVSGHTYNEELGLRYLNKKNRR